MTCTDIPVRPAITVLLLLVASRSALVAAQTETLESLGPFELKEAGYDFALNLETSGFAVISKRNGTVTLYLPEYFEGDESKAVGPVQIGEEPSSIIYKKHGSTSVFAIGCMKDPNIRLLDAVTLAPVGKIDVGGGTSLLATAEDDPYVYYIRTWTGVPSGTDLPDVNAPGTLQKSERDLLLADTRFVGRVNTKTMADEGIVWQASDYAISPDGRHLYVRDRFREPHFIELGQSTPTGVAARTIFRRGESTGRFVVDPHGQYVFTIGGEQAYSSNLRRVIPGFRPSEPVAVAVFRQLPFVATLSKSGNVSLHSYNMLEREASVGVPREMRPYYSTRGWGPRDPDAPNRRLHADDRNRRLILVNSNRVMLFPLGDRGEVEKQPILQVDVPWAKEVVVEKPNTIPLGISEPDVKVELAVPVPGMSVNAGELHWTPSQNQLGGHTIPLRLIAGEHVKETVIELDVTRPHAVVPFLAGDCCVDPEGSLAAVWSGEIPKYNESHNSDYYPSSWRHHLALVDLKEGRVVAKIILPAPLRAVAIDRRYVYLAVHGGKSIEVRSRKDLSVVTEAFLLEQVPIRAIRSVADKYLVAVTGYGEIRRFSLPDLKACDPPTTSGPRDRMARFRLDRSPPVPVRDLGAWTYFDGCVYDKATGRRCLISSSPSDSACNIITLEPEVKAPNPTAPSYSRINSASIAVNARLAEAPLPWNRALEQFIPGRHPPQKPSLETVAGETIAEVEPNTILLDSLPLMVTSRGTYSTSDGGRPPGAPGQGNRPDTSPEHDEARVRRPTVELDVRDLLSGRQRDVVRLFRSTIPLNHGSGSALLHRMRAAGATVVVLCQGWSRVRPEQTMRLAWDRMKRPDPDEATRGFSPVYSYTFPATENEDLVPPGFQPVQSAMAVPGDRSTTLTHELTGSVANAEFELAEPLAGISIDAKTGDVTLDGPALAELVLSNVSNGYVRTPAPPAARDSRSPTTRALSVEDYCEQVAPVFQEFVGRPPQGIPGLVPVKLRMNVDKKPIAQLSYYVFLEAPTAALEKSLAAARLEKLNEGIARLHEVVARFEASLAEIDAAIDQLKRDAEAVSPSPALELRMQLLEDSRRRIAEKTRKIKELLKSKGVE